jgi:aspartyl-tRNA(Asn)/glutamyl-tRNA(Gln) amidotransferase subunit A
MLQVIAGDDAAEPTSARFPISNYNVDLNRSTPSVRIGVPRDFFFENLDPEVDAAAATALSVLRQMAASLTDVVLPSRPEGQELLRSAVRSAEAYAYHFDAVNHTPDRYQPETLARIRSGSEITARAYIQARRDLAQARRGFERAFESVDVLVTPTLPAPAPTTAQMNRGSGVVHTLGRHCHTQHRALRRMGQSHDNGSLWIYPKRYSHRFANHRAQWQRGVGIATGASVRESDEVAHPRP